jgi:hypothetical protein
MSSITLAMPAHRRLRPARPVVAVAAIVVVVALIALFSIRPVPGVTSGRDDTSFATGYAAAVADFRASTAELQAQGAQVAGQSTAQILPIYVGLREATQTAADRFAKLHPPAKAKADYQTFVSLLRAQAAALDRVVRDAKSGSARSLAADLQKYAGLVSDWLAVRPRNEAATH